MFNLCTFSCNFIARSGCSALSEENLYWKKKKKDFINEKGMLEFRSIVCIDEIIFDIRVFLKNDVQQKNLCLKLGRNTLETIPYSKSNRTTFFGITVVALSFTLNSSEQLWTYLSLPIASWKHQKTKGFLMFSGAMGRDQWHEMGSAQQSVS